MTEVSLPGGATLSAVHTPGQSDQPTFVFFNPLSGSFDLWEAAVAPALRDAGFGTLGWNYRGQPASQLAPEDPLTAASITRDGVDLIQALQPQRPIFVGLSIGGLFALRAHMLGASSRGILLINTLRVDSPRLRWINDAVTRCTTVGGLRLMRDLYLPLLFGQEWLEQNRPNFLIEGAYEPLSASDNDARLLAAGATADWNIAYEDLAMPVTVMSGLQDHVFYDEAVVRSLTGRIADVQSVDLDKAGHMIPVEDPKAVIAACRDLASRIP